LSEPTLRILCLGDLVGRPGRRAVREGLPVARREQRLDFTLVNVENATNGAGIRAKEGIELLSYGVDVMTSGDHALDFPETGQYLAAEPRLLRPVNYDMPGLGAHVYPCGEHLVGVVNVAGHVFMRERCKVRNAFHAALEAVNELRKRTPVVLVDMHGEATSEKIAMGWHLDGLASAVFGTHTHVQTADVQILPRGTGYITDLGMTGPHYGVIGREMQAVLRRFTSDAREHMKVAREWNRLTGAIFEINARTGRCVGAGLFRHQVASTTEPDTE
jgi:metallophosphoesterase (TIGR00282 family)